MGLRVRESIENHQKGRNRNQLENMIKSDYYNLSLKKQIQKKAKVNDSHSPTKWQQEITTLELQKKARK